MQSDILATASITATGNLKTADGANNIAACRIRAIYYNASVAGTLTFRDGGSGGDVKITLAIPAGAETITLPDRGVWFNRGTPHLTVTTATLSGVTVFYS
jgi:hypothetical protein